MNIKSLLLGSAAALFAVTGAKAADAIVYAEPEPVEYVRVCDAYGAGYFYIPGTETCLRISGYVRADIKGGDNVYATNRRQLLNSDTYQWRTRATLRFHTASATELGTLRTFVELRSQWDNNGWGYDRDSNSYYQNGVDDSADGQLRFAYIELGGLRVGLDETIFDYWTGYYGNVIHDDLITPAGYMRTNVISYTFNNGNGFSAILGVEQGDGYNEIDDYTPNVVGGLKFAQGWGAISAVAAYDAVQEEWAAKVRLDVNVTDNFSLWVMGGYKSADDYYEQDYVDGLAANPYDGRRYVSRVTDNYYGNWGGEWAAWLGGTFDLNEKASINGQVSYDDTETLAAALNVRYEIVPGLTITPEVAYIQWNDDVRTLRGVNGNPIEVRSSLDGEDAFVGMIRLQRSF